MGMPALARRPLVAHGVAIAVAFSVDLHARVTGTHPYANRLVCRLSKRASHNTCWMQCIATLKDYTALNLAFITD